MVEPLPESTTVHIHAIEGDCNGHEQIDRAGEGLGGNKRPRFGFGVRHQRHGRTAAGNLTSHPGHDAQLAEMVVVPLLKFYLHERRASHPILSLLGLLCMPHSGLLGHS